MTRLIGTLKLDDMDAVLHVEAFADNYIWLLRRGDAVAIVDPGDAAPVVAALDRLGLTPLAILCTHHHGDHTGGVENLLARWRVPVYGPARERIPGITHRVGDGDRVTPGDGLGFEVLEVPGHTAGHIAYHGQGALFCGDTLFSAGCGRLFEGSAVQMHASLARLAALPEDTRVYCAHEYTASNLRFARAADPDNPDIAAHQVRVAALRAAGRPTLPSTIGLERRVNPFLRAHLPALKHSAEAHAGRTLSGPAAVFAELRHWKDGFRA